MMQKRSLLTLLVVLLLAVGLAGCGGDEEPEPTDTPVPVVAAPTDTPVPPTDTPVPPTDTPVPPTNTPEPTSPPAEEGGQASSGGESGGAEASAAETQSAYASPSDVLKSFRSRGTFAMTSTYADGSTEQQVMQFEGAFVAADNAYGSDEYVAITVNEGDVPQSMTIYKVGDNVFVNSEGEWITVGRDNSGMFTMMADIFTSMMSEVIVNMDEAQNLGEEAINGVQAVHYRVDEPEVFKRMAQITGEQDGVIETVAVNVWVATDGNYVVKYSIQASVTGVPTTDDAGNDVVADQTVDWSFEIYDINSGDVTVTLPPDAPEPGVVSIPGFAEGEFPLPEGAEIEMSMFGMPQVVSDLSEEDLTAFYRQALTDLGWTFNGTMGFYEVSKDDVSFTMWISTDPETGKSTAQIITEQ